MCKILKSMNVIIVLLWILYPFFSLFMAYIFFTVEDHFFIIDTIMGLGFIIIPPLLLCYIAYDKYIRKSTKLIHITKSIFDGFFPYVFTGVVSFLISLVLLIIVGLIFSLYSIFLLLNKWPYYYLCFLPCIFYLTWLSLKKWTHSYKLIAYTRTIFDLLLFFLPYVGLFVSCYLIIYLFDRIPNVKFFLFNYSCGDLFSYTFGLSFILFVGSCVGIYYGAKQKQFLVFSAKKYTLFLRSFGIDPNIEDAIICSIPKCNETQILKIGNPRKHEKNNFYVPSDNWKKHVSYYISRAEKVICVIDNTDGVRWEIMNHLEYAYKYWYYAYDISILQDIKTKFPIDSDYKKKMVFCINNLIEKHISGPITFRIINNKCYYYKGMMFSEVKNSYFIIPSEFSECEDNINNQSPFFYKFVDTIRKFLRISKSTSQFGIFSLGMVFSFIFIVCGGLMGVFMILSGIFAILSALVKVMLYLNLDIDFFQDTILGTLLKLKIKPSVGSIIGDTVGAFILFIIGSYFIKNTFGSFKE